MKFCAVKTCIVLALQMAFYRLFDLSLFFSELISIIFEYFIINVGVGIPIFLRCWFLGNKWKRSP